MMGWKISRANKGKQTKAPPLMISRMKFTYTEGSGYVGWMEAVPSISQGMDSIIHIVA